MGLFDKLWSKKEPGAGKAEAKEEKPQGQEPLEKNEIMNRDLKELLGNSALQLLVEGQDYEKLDGLQCTFGYLFTIEGHGLEALFKMETDKTTAYFAAQGESLMRLSFTEELFEATRAKFLELHPAKPE